MKKVLKVMGIVLAALVVIALCVYFLALRYPELKADPKVGKWYWVSDSSMKDSEGHGYHALFKKGSENKVMVYFAGGGASDDMPCTTVEVPAEGLGLLDALTAAGLVPSRGEGRRLVQQGGVSVDDAKQSDPFAVIPAAAFDKGYVIVKKGKKIFHKIQKA